MKSSRLGFLFIDRQKYFLSAVLSTKITRIRGTLKPLIKHSDNSKTSKLNHIDYASIYQSKKVLNQLRYREELRESKEHLKRQQIFGQFRNVEIKSPLLSVYFSIDKKKKNNLNLPPYRKELRLSKEQLGIYRNIQIGTLSS